MIIKLIILVIGIILLGWLRYRSLLQRAETLFAQSAQFPTTYQVGNKADPGVTYLVLGDSTAVGTGASRLETSYPYQVALAVSKTGKHVAVINAAQNGARLSDLLHQLQKADSIKPDLISISIGANDATHRTPIDQFESQMTEILAILSRTSARKILLSNSIGFRYTPALPPGFSHLVTAHARRQSQLLANLPRDPRISIVDLFNKVRLKGRDQYAIDLFHPSDLGYQQWTRAFVSALPEL